MEPAGSPSWAWAPLQLRYRASAFFLCDAHVGDTPLRQHPVLLPVAEDIPAGRTDDVALAPGTARR